MKREPGMAYNTTTLNKVFAVLSVLLLLTVIWVVLDDYIRPWKAVQVKAMDIERQVAAAKVKKLEGSIDATKLAEAKEQLAAAEKEITTHEESLRKIQDKIADVQKRIYVQNMYNGVQGSQAAAWQFKYEHALSEKHFEEAKKYKKKFDEYKANEIAGKDQLKAQNAEEAGYNAEIKKIEEKKLAAEKNLKSIIGDKERIEQRQRRPPCGCCVTPPSSTSWIPPSRSTSS